MLKPGSLERPRRIASGLAFLAALLLVTPLWAQAWRGPVSLGVEVTDPQGAPVPGAEVRLEYAETEPYAGPPPGLTDASGRLELFGLAEGLWRVQVERQGFSPYLVVIRLDAGKKKVLITAGPLRDATAPPLEVEFVKAEAPAGRERTAEARQERKQEKGEKKGKKKDRRGRRISQQEPAEPAPAPQPQIRPVPAPAPPAPPQPAPEPAAPEPTAARPQPTAPPSTAAPEPAAVPEPSAAMPPKSEPEAAPAPPPPAAVETPELQPAPEPVVAPTPVTPEAEPAIPPVPQVTPAAVEEPEAVPEPEPEAPPTSRPELVAAPEPPPAIPPPAPQPKEVPPPPEPSPPTEAAAAPLPSPEPAPALAPAPSPRPQPVSAVRSYRAGTCTDCKPGEGVASAVRFAAAGDGACPAGWKAAVERAVGQLTADPAVALAGYTGPLFLGPTGAERLPAVASEATLAQIEDLLAPWIAADSDCQLLAVVLDPGVEFTGYRYEVRDASGASDCLAGQECPLGAAAWEGHPQIEKTRQGTFLWSLFENRSRDKPRRAELTVYFDPTP